MEKYNVSEVIEGKTIYHETVADDELVGNIHRNYQKRYGGKRKKIIRTMMVLFLLGLVGVLIFKPEIAQNISNNLKNLFNLNPITSLTGNQESLTESGFDLLSGNLLSDQDLSNEEKIMLEIEKMVESLSDSGVGL